MAEPDGGVPFVLPSARGYPLASWMVPGGGSHLTFGLVALLGTTNVKSAWLSAATLWCWDRLHQPEDLSAYWLKYAFEFLNRATSAQRAIEAIEALRPLLNPDGSIPVSGGTAGETLTALTLSHIPELEAGALFTDQQIAACLEQLEAGQQDDGGWSFDWAAWAPRRPTSGVA